MTILNGFSNPIAKRLANLSIHAYKWYYCASCPESNKKFATVGIKVDKPNAHNSGWWSVFIVYWPKRYVVITWRGHDCGCGEGQC